MINLDELEARARAANTAARAGGLWLVGHDQVTRHPYVETAQLGSDGHQYGFICWKPDDDEEPTREAEAQAQHIATASPDTVLELVSRLRELEAYLANAQLIYLAELTRAEQAESKLERAQKIHETHCTTLEARCASLEASLKSAQDVIDIVYRAVV